MEFCPKNGPVCSLVLVSKNSEISEVITERLDSATASWSAVVLLSSAAFSFGYHLETPSDTSTSHLLPFSLSGCTPIPRLTAW